MSNKYLKTMLPYRVHYNESECDIRNYNLFYNIAKKAKARRAKGRRHISARRAKKALPETNRSKFDRRTRTLMPRARQTSITNAAKVTS